VDSPAKTSASQGGVAALTATDQGCGWSLPGSFARWDPATSSWKTRQCSLLGDLDEFSETWPRWGSMLNGECCLRPMLAHRTSGKGSGFWPTPCATDSRGSGVRGVLRDRLDYAVERGQTKARRYVTQQAPVMWPTPTVVTDTGGAAMCKWGGSGARAKLRTMVSPEEMNGALNPMWVEWLMGWPIGSTSYERLAMDKFHEWRQQHSEF
jgi:hypothetical protein